jgi:hypothetical protein
VAAVPDNPALAALAANEAPAVRTVATALITKVTVLKISLKAAFSRTFRSSIRPLITCSRMSCDCFAKALDKSIAPLIVIAVMVPFSYLLNEFIFKKQKFESSRST